MLVFPRPKFFLDEEKPKERNRTGGTVVKKLRVLLLLGDFYPVLDAGWDYNIVNNIFI